MKPICVLAIFVSLCGPLIALPSRAAEGDPSETYVHAKVLPVEHDAVQLTDGFWSTIRSRSRDVGVSTLLDHFEKNGHVENFRICAEQKHEKHHGGPNCNEFFYKQLEAMARYAPESGEISRRLEDVMRTVLSAQQPDGYLNTFYENPLVKENGRTRFAEMNRFEFYNFGHFAQAAIADYRASGRREMLDAAIRFADLIVDRFADPNDLPYKLYRGAVNQKYEHPNHELAFVELYRVTGDRRYLDFVTQTLTEYGYFDDEHFNEMWGHAVQENLLEAGAANLYLETGDSRIWEVVTRLWDDVRYRKMYITGGTGSSSRGEAYGKEYELPNATAYSETCAAIALTFWHHKMLLATGDAKYADEMERTLYNNVLAGYGLDGRSYFYQNPLDWDPDERKRGGRRFPWHGCPCCPPNLHRLFAMLDQYIYTQDDLGIQVNLYANTTLRHTFSDGRTITVTMETGVPFAETVTLTFEGDLSAAGTLKLRVPQWCDEPELTIDGAAQTAKRDGGFLVVDTPWRRGDELTLTLPMPARVIQGDSRVADQVDRIAIQRGPIVYCVEQADNPGLDLGSISLPKEPRIDLHPENDILGQMTRLTVAAKQVDEEGCETDVEVEMIPYYAWANRELGRMMIWLPTKTGQFSELENTAAAQDESCVSSRKTNRPNIGPVWAGDPSPR